MRFLIIGKFGGYFYSMNNSDEKNSFEVVEYLIPPEANGERLDKYIGNSEEIELTRSRAQKLFDEGLITIDEKLAERKQILNGGERLIVPEESTFLLFEWIIVRCPTEPSVQPAIPLYMRAQARR